MFLNRLDKEAKEVFLLLANHVARSDESFSDAQKSLISGYAKEMDMPAIEYDEDSFDLQSSIQRVTDKEFQKIILIEVLAIVYTDHMIHPAEKEIIDIIVDTWKINSSLVIAYGEWSKSLLSLYIQGEALLDLN